MPIYFYEKKNGKAEYFSYLFDESSKIRLFSLSLSLFGGAEHNEVVSTFGYLALWQVFNTHTAR